MADINAHHAAWHSISDDNRASTRGDEVHAAICDSNLSLLNLDYPTRLPRGGPASSPDITLISAHLLLDATWQVDLALSSDHLPILISIQDLSYNYHGQRKSFTNYKRANWIAYRDEVESSLDGLPLPTSCSEGEAILRKILQTASKHHIPAGVRKNYIPALSARRSKEPNTPT